MSVAAVEVLRHATLKTLFQTHHARREADLRAFWRTLGGFAHYVASTLVATTAASPTSDSDGVALYSAVRLPNAPVWAFTGPLSDAAIAAADATLRDPIVVRNNVTVKTAAALPSPLPIVSWPVVDRLPFTFFFDAAPQASDAGATTGIAPTMESTLVSASIRARSLYDAALPCVIRRVLLSGEKQQKDQKERKDHHRHHDHHKRDSADQQQQGAKNPDANARRRARE
jgi:hypothetical protein